MMTQAMAMLLMPKNIPGVRADILYKIDNVFNVAYELCLYGLLKDTMFKFEMTNSRLHWLCPMSVFVVLKYEGIVLSLNECCDTANTMYAKFEAPWKSYASNIITTEGLMHLETTFLFLKLPISSYMPIELLSEPTCVGVSVAFLKALQFEHVDVMENVYKNVVATLENLIVKAPETGNPMILAAMIVCLVMDEMQLATKCITSDDDVVWASVRERIARNDNSQLAMLAKQSFDALNGKDAPLFK